MNKMLLSMLSLLLIFLLLIVVNDLTAKTFNNDFETGDLTDWEKTGTAFDYQPTWGDNPTARNRGQPSQHQGDWWLGLAERYQGPDKGAKLGQKPGDMQQNAAGGVAPDFPQGTLTSIEFKIVGETMNFLMGGGNRPWDVNPEPCCVNLVMNDDVVRTVTGDNNESMTRKEWDVSDLKGKTVQLVVIDQSSGGWGHPNFDDIHQANASGKNIPWDQIMAVEAQGKLAVSWAQMKKYYR